MIKDLSELNQKINSLGKPKEGYTRVYRGQTKIYPQLLPSENRGIEIKGRHQWDLYCEILAKHLVSEESKKNSKPHSDVEELEGKLFVKALSQHYGPGTKYLDVTFSLDIAVWFALNEIERIDFHSYSGKGTEVEDDDVYVQHEFLKYNPSNNSGWIYVLDVPLKEDWHSFFLEGGCFNLNHKLKSVFSKSERIKVQQACLIHSKSESNRNDCSIFQVCQPLEIHPNCLSELNNELNTTSLFPSPDMDEWYSRFIHVPFIHGGFTSDGRIAARKIIPVEFYLDNTESNYFKSIFKRLTTINPFNQYLSFIPRDNQEKKLLDEAIPIILANPIMATMPSVEDGRWNEALLWKYAGLTEKSQDEYMNSNPLHFSFDHNFFVEFSPLEKVNWQEIDTINQEDICVRSVWIISMELYQLKIVLNVLGWGGLEGSQFEFNLFYNKDTNSIVLQSSEGDDKFIPIASMGFVADAIFSALTFIGDSLPGIGIKPFASAIGDENNYLVFACDKGVKIEPTIEIPGRSKSFYGVFNLETGAAYHSVGDHLRNGYAVNFYSDKSFSELTSDFVIEQFTSKYNMGKDFFK